MSFEPDRSSKPTLPVPVVYPRAGLVGPHIPDDPTQLDAEATVQRAFRYGRSPETLKDILRGRGESQVSPVWRLDATVAETTLRDLKPRFDTSPIDAGLRVVEGRVEATPPVSGREPDVAATVAWLGANRA